MISILLASESLIIIIILLGGACSGCGCYGGAVANQPAFSTG